jgi:hypothetical protein
MKHFPDIGEERSARHEERMVELVPSATAKHNLLCAVENTAHQIICSPPS